MLETKLHIIHTHASRENVGDDAIVIAIQRLLKQAFPSNDISYTCIASDNRSRPGENVTGYLPISKIYRPSQWKALTNSIKKCDLIVIGGGELICGAPEYLMLLPLAKLYSVPVIFLGVGADINRISFLPKLYTAKTLNLANKYLVRDQKAEDIILSFNVPSKKIETTADVVFSLMPDEQNQSAKSGIGICLRSTQRLDRALTQERLKTLAEYLNSLISEKNTSIHLFPFIPYATDLNGKKSDIDNDFMFGLPYSDEAIMDQLYNLIERKECVVKHPPLMHPEEIIKIFSELDMVISMRLHALILSALAGTKFIAVDYADKIGRVMDELNASKRVIPIDTLDTMETLSNEVNRISDISFDEVNSSLKKLNNLSLLNSTRVAEVYKQDQKKNKKKSPHLIYPFLIFNYWFIYLMKTKNPLILFISKMKKNIMG